MSRFSLGFSKSSLAAIVVSTTCLGLGVGGMTYAASQSAGDGVITACRSTKSGDLRLPTKHRPCVTEGAWGVRERVLSWNEEGPQGAAGATGVTGAKGAEGAPGPRGVPGAAGPAGPIGPNGADGDDGAPGADGDDGAPGVPGADGAPGQQGPSGVLAADGFLGTVSSQAGLGYRFIGGTTSVTVAAGQRLMASGTAALGTDGPEFLFRLDACYQNTTPPGPLTSFVAPENSLLSSVSDATMLYTTSPTVVAPTAGTYNVGLCLDPIGGNINDNGTANGWVMVANGS